MTTIEAVEIGGRDLFDLTGRRALVTGASRGIGRAIALGLARYGADVLATARGKSGLAETARLAEGLPGSIRTHAADLCAPRAAEDCVAAAAELLGGLDILVNNAADEHDAPIEETDLAKFQRVMELDLQSCWLLARTASPHLAAGGGGKVINVASVAGLVGLQNSTAYVAAKHGLVGLTRVLALEWGPRDVHVNALCPGWVDTAMARGMLVGNGGWVRDRTPLGRWAQPEEMIGPAVFLASRASSFMTGQVLVVDGGWTAQ